MERPSELRPICQAGKDADPGWYRIHRRVSIYATWVLLHTALTPNQISLIMMAMAGVGAWLLASASLAWNLAGFGLLYLAFLLDKADGEVARYRGTQSVQGILLDRIHHLLIEPAILFAAAWRAYQIVGTPWVLIAAMIAVVVGNVIEEQTHWAAYAFFKHLRAKQPVRPAPRDSRAASLRRAYAWFRPLKAFRMFIVVLPTLALLYVLERVTARPWVELYVYLVTITLTIYLAFQSYYYFALQLESEIDEYRPFVVAGTDPVDGGFTDHPEQDGLRQRVRPHSARQRIHTDRPGKVSGVDHEAPFRPVRDASS